jgi:hypothetical protein
MTDFGGHSRIYHGHMRHMSHRRARRLVAGAALAGCALMLAAGCAAKSAGATGTSQAARNSAAPHTPRQAVAAAAVHTAGLTSATLTLTEDASGRTSEAISGSIQERLKPSLLVSMQLRLASGAASETAAVVLTSNAIYLKSAELARQTGKQWIKVSFSALNRASSSVGQLFQSLSKINPARQDLLFAGATNVRDVGTQAIGGVATTQYSGSITASSALATIPPGLRKEVAPELKAITGTPRFNIWIDAQGHFRKTVLHETANGQAITTMVVFSSINQPVHIAVPPASQTATLPAGALSGAGA